MTCSNFHSCAKAKLGDYACDHNGQVYVDNCFVPCQKHKIHGD